jgi:hypothetical protein
LSTTWHVNVGDTIRWKFAIKSFDIGFRVILRTMGEGGALEEVVVDPIKVAEDSFAEGTWTVEETGTVVILWDNTDSILRSKEIAYKAEVVRAGEPLTDDWKLSTPAETVTSTLPEGALAAFAFMYPSILTCSHAPAYVMCSFQIRTLLRHPSRQKLLHVSARMNPPLTRTEVSLRPWNSL